MNTLIRLFDLYKKYGLSAHGGMFPWHFDRQHPAEGTRLHLILPFMSVVYQKQAVSAGGGISPLEVLFMSGLSQAYRPKKVFIIGNAFGWSTFALGLANPDAKVVAIDALLEGGHVRDACIITQEIITKEKLDNIVLLQGLSPNDVPAIVEEHLDGEIDLVLIDGKHTNEQQLLDFDAVYPYTGTKSIILLHDVLNYNMIESFNQIRKKYPALCANILMRTPSGMGAFHGADTPAEAVRVIEVFTEEKEQIRRLQKRVQLEVQSYRDSLRQKDEKR